MLAARTIPSSVAPRVYHRIAHTENLFGTEVLTGTGGLYQSKGAPEKAVDHLFPRVSMCLAATCARDGAVPNLACGHGPSGPGADVLSRLVGVVEDAVARPFENVRLFVAQGSEVCCYGSENR